MKKVVRLTESDLVRIVKRVMNESDFSPNVIKYSQNMMGNENPFRERRIPRSKFQEGDRVRRIDGDLEGTVKNVMFDHDNNEHIYEVRFVIDGGGAFRQEVTGDEITSVDEF